MYIYTLYVYLYYINYLNIITSWCVHLKKKIKKNAGQTFLQADVARKTVAAPEASSDQ